MFCKKTVNDLKPYKVVPQEVWEHPDGVLKLDWNESTIPVSNCVKNALKEAIECINLNWYPNVANGKLMKLLADYAELPIANIMYFASSDSAQEYIARTFLEADDDVLIIGPTYDNFRVTCQSESYHIHFFYMNADLEIDMDELKNAICEVSPKLVYLSNPNNPTGTTYTKEDIKVMIERFPNILFLVDEAYIEFSRLRSVKDLVLDHRNVIITRTFSKAFGLAGFRIGYILSNEYNLEYIARIRNPKSITSLTQVAAIAALEDLGYMHNYVKEVLTAKKWFLKQLDMMRVNYKVDGGNFVLVKIDFPHEYIAFLRKHKIYVRDYTHVEQLYGYNCRITIGTMEQMKVVKQYTQAYLNLFE